MAQLVLKALHTKDLLPLEAFHCPNLHAVYFALPLHLIVLERLQHSCLPG